MTAAPRASGAAHGRNLGSLLLRSAYRLRVTGAHLVPRRGPLLLVANHTSDLDAAVLFAAGPRPVHLMTRADGFVPPLDRLLRSTGQIAVRCGEPDREALRSAAAVLADGRAVGLFPEGSPGPGDVARIRHGVAYLQARTGAAVVPVAILGTRAAGQSAVAWPPARTLIDVVFGTPLDLVPVPDPCRRADLARLGERVRQGLADHVRLASARTGQDIPGDEPARPDVRGLAAREAS
ncbi:MAG: lysophospholipid acyltransferase family protein [Candidatus Nanopelagicales bacterium]